MAGGIGIDDRIRGAVGLGPPWGHRVPQRLSGGVHELVQAERSPRQAPDRGQAAIAGCGSFGRGDVVVAGRFRAGKRARIVLAALRCAHRHVADQRLLSLIQNRGVVRALACQDAGVRVEPRQYEVRPAQHHHHRQDQERRTTLTAAVACHGVSPCGARGSRRWARARRSLRRCCGRALPRA